MRNLVLIAALVAPFAATAEPALTIHDGVSGPAQAWGAAMESEDIAALIRMHNPQTVAYPPGQMELKGSNAIIADYKSLFLTYSVKVSVEDAHWVEVPPLVVSWGLTTLTLHPKAGGTDVVSKTRFTDAAIQVDGGWQYVVDHASKPTGP